MSKRMRANVTLAKMDLLRYAIKVYENVLGKK